jgi:hypothetical protein
VESGVNINEFASCERCKRGIDLFHPPQFERIGGEIVCVHCLPHDNPIPEHMRADIEPYILRRCEAAVNEYIRTMAVAYLEKSSGV